MSTDQQDQPDQQGEQVCRQLIEIVRQIVGSNDKENYQLGFLHDHIREIKSRAHPERLAAPLIAALSSDNARNNFKAFEQAEKDAVKYRWRYVLDYRIAFVLILFTLVASAGVQVGPFSDEFMTWLRRASINLLIISLLISLLLIWRMQHLGHYEKWQEHRGTAEYLRRHCMEKLFDGPVRQEEGECPPLLLKLFYFRRYQLEMQQAYLRIRGKYHERRSFWAHFMLFPAVITAAFMALIMALSALSAWFDQGAWPEWVPNFMLSLVALSEYVELIQLDSIALLVVFSVALIYLLLMFSVMIEGNMRDAARFAVARENLDYLAGAPFEEACMHACYGRREEVMKYIVTVHRVMANEQSDWVRLNKLAHGAEIRQTFAELIK